VGVPASRGVLGRGSVAQGRVSAVVVVLVFPAHRREVLALGQQPIGRQGARYASTALPKYTRVPGAVRHLDA
jgi:hypothetical protein